MNKLSGLILAILSMCALGTTGQSVPPLINYQGRLTDAAGMVLPDGAYRVAFKVWDDPTLASTNVPTHLIWGSEYGITLIGGTFNVILGAGGGAAVPGAAVNDLGFAFGESNRFFGLTITQIPTGPIAPDQQREILPRQQFLSVPFAVQAQQAQRAQVASSLIADAANTLAPPGSIIAFGGSNIPKGWLACDGSAVVRTGVYSSLFAAIGTTWGAGDGANSFNLPDLRGMFLRGSGVNATQNMAAGGKFGAGPVGTFQADTYQAHWHNLATRNQNLFSAAPITADTTLFEITSLNTFPISGVFDSTTDGTHGAPRIGNETKPANSSVLYIIKY